MRKKNLVLKNSGPAIHIKRRAAGDFSETTLMTISLKAEEMWSNGTQANVYKSHTEAAKAVLANQTAEFEILNNKDKDQTVRVGWINPCAIEVSDCTTNCDITEPMIETNSEEYAFDICKKTGFSVDRETLRTNIYDRETVAARGMAKAIKALDEYWSQQILLRAKAYAGINVAPAPWTFDAPNMTTNVPAADYNLKMLANVMNQAELNQMSSPYYIENGGLWVPVKDSDLDSGNLDGKGDAARASEWGLYFDKFNFAKAGLTEDMFAIDAGAIAFQSYNRYPDAPMEIGGTVQQTHYSVNSQQLPGVTYGVIYTVKCVAAGGKTRIVDTWRVITEGGIWKNPGGCPVVIDEVTYTPSGILSYTKTA